MEKFLPGLHRLPAGMRRSIGWSVLIIVTLSVVLPIIAVASMGPACGGGYPGVYCKAAMDTIVDRWRMYNRECVSYTAYRVAASGRLMPAGFGDANNWPAAAVEHGIVVDGTPRVGDVAIRTDHNHGHSMYVEAVNPNGTIRVSQYNLYKTGTFSQDTIRPDGLRFIHF